MAWDEKEFEAYEMRSKLSRHREVLQELACAIRTLTVEVGKMAVVPGAKPDRGTEEESSSAAVLAEIWQKMDILCEELF